MYQYYRYVRAHVHVPYITRYACACVLVISCCVIAYAYRHTTSGHLQKSADFAYPHCLNQAGGIRQGMDPAWTLPPR